MKEYSEDCIHSDVMFNLVAGTIILGAITFGAWITHSEAVGTIIAMLAIPGLAVYFKLTEDKEAKDTWRK